jgi:hypothetical protein
MSWASQIQFYSPLLMNVFFLGILTLADISRFLYYSPCFIWSTNYSILVSLEIILLAFINVKGPSTRAIFS